MAYCVQFLVLFLYYWFWISDFSLARDCITTTQILADPETLESSNAVFRFGFFSPNNSTNRYVGIWYNAEVADTLEVVWVANRENPLTNSSGVIHITGNGNLQLADGHNKSIWSTNVRANDEVYTSIVQLLDTGNLVLLSNASGSVIWQSFDHPTDSLLPHMHVTLFKNMTRPLAVSWKTPSEPSNGRFTSGINHRMLSEIFIWDGDRPYWRSGPWDGNVFLGIWVMYFSAHNDGLYIESEDEGTFNVSYSSTTKRVREHYVLGSDGIGLQKVWDNETGKWIVIWQTLETECDIYGKCGEFGRCNSNKIPICSCLKGFEPTNNLNWSAGYWSGGCVRRTPLECERIGGLEDGFLKLRNMKVPDNAEWLESRHEEDCRRQCLRNCSCSAYAYYMGFGCMVWKGSLIDIQDFFIVGVDLFIRLAKSELGGDTSLWKLIVAVTVIICAVVILYILWRWMDRRHGKTESTSTAGKLNPVPSMCDAKCNEVEFQYLQLFELEDLLVATDDFSERNKLGRGGFGTVYKGKFKDGREIAVKRLSRDSLQGLQEFMNEVVVISKLQHINLVRLLGCCVEDEEKLLVYEYLQNTSLDAILFDSSRQEQLDWQKRFNIIKGIARGLLYLHRDSRLRIIHRDLKASNILLDGNLNPKISDFGMARIFGGDKDQDDTRRIVGTYGYMSPEYAMGGRFSEKSDVFSFGVLLLEIVSGRRNNGFMDDEYTISLFSHAWKLWNEDNILLFVDPKISKSPFQAEILKCIQLGLLCVQEFPEDRPTISLVISMIESEVIDLPCPTPPGFTQRLIASNEHYSVNGVTISSLIAR